MNVTLTAIIGDNSDLLPNVFSIYGKDKSKLIVADVTFGKGVFWRKINTNEFAKFLKSDLLTGTNFSNLPYESNSIDVLVLDPPYMHGGKTVKKSINDCYQNQNTSHESIVRSYTKGILESSRVLKRNGLILIKCQDEIESAKQRLSHVEILTLLDLFGFKINDIFILVQKSIPAMRNDYQNSARKNHSYMIVAEFKK